VVRRSCHRPVTCRDRNPREACQASRLATSSLGLDDRVYGYWRGPLPLRWVYLHVLRELAQHRGHADILREQILHLEPAEVTIAGSSGNGVRRPMIPSQWRTAKRFTPVLGRQMAYVEAGTGRPIVLLHGNPTSSYLWRSVLPALQGLGRCIVPDLIGMGDSDKLGADDPQRYTFTRHREFLDALLEALGVRGDAVLVVHDWGSALGFDWARRHPGRVAAIAYMEALVRPFDSWDEWPPQARSIFQRLRSPAGEELILDRNVFVERILPASVLRPLTAEEMGEYRRPFAAAGDGRLPTLVWPRQIPVAGEPADVHQACAAYAAWLASAPGLPKLFINAEPGSILTGAVRDFCRTWPDQAEVTVPGIHFIQEDSGAQIGRAVASWLGQLPGVTA
jgi:haloalkane dehalogenase